MRGGVIPGQGENLWVLAARSGIGKTTVAIAAAMGLANNGAGVLFLSCELGAQAISARFCAHTCRRNLGYATSLFTTNDLEGRGQVVEGDDLVLLRRLLEPFQQGLRPDGQPMGKLLYQSQFAATLEEVCAVVEDTKAANPDLAVVVLDHFHAMGASPGYGVHTTTELAHRAMGLKALAGRCDLDILVVAQLNRGAYGSSSPDVSHLAGTSELERFASAVWLIDRPKTPEGATARSLATTWAAPSSASTAPIASWRRTRRGGPSWGVISTRGWRPCERHRAAGAGGGARAIAHRRSLPP
jgi:replicative DNA helicase